MLDRGRRHIATIIYLLLARPDAPSSSSSSIDARRLLDISGLLNERGRASGGASHACSAFALLFVSLLREQLSALSST